MNARSRERICPLLESLEPRRLLACDVQFRQGILTVLGDKSDNSIDVVVGQQGVLVRCDGKPAGPFASVRSIAVNGGVGDDRLRFDADGSLVPAVLPQVAEFAGGQGQDMFRILASAAQQLTLDGGQHADNYDIQFGRLLGAVRVNDTGQAGEDRLQLVGNDFGDVLTLDGGTPQGWIAKWEGPDLNGAGNEVAIESIEIAHEGIELGDIQIGGGDDQVTIDDRDGKLLPVSLEVHGDGSLQGTLLIARQQALRDRNPHGVRLFEGGNGRSELIVDGRGDVPNKYGIQGGPDSEFLEIEVSPVHGQKQSTDIVAVDQDRVTIKGGDGDDEVEFDVNDDGLVTPVDALLGGGHDKVTISASLLAELVEVVGVELEKPDPLIRVSDLATGASLLQASVFDAEAISVNTAGGDDQVILREQDASLAGIDWTIETGGGNDRVDARLAAIPDVFDVLTGQGNDQVSLVFADNPNIPASPRDPAAPLPEVTVNAGAGVDAVKLDVFSAPQSPPSDLQEASANVTLEEVAASIFITGVGLLDMLALFPLGSLAMHQAVRDDRMGRAKSEIEMTVAGADLDVDLTTGATLDSILIGLAPRPESTMALKLNTGAGDDDVAVRVTNPTPSQGGTDPEPPEEARRRVAVAINSGEGDDHVDVNLPAVQTGGPPRLDLDVAIQAGAGDDVVRIENNAAEGDGEQKVRVDGGAGKDGVTVLLRRLANPHLPQPTAALLAATDLTQIDLDGGGGDDRVSLDFQGTIGQQQAVDAVLRGGAGNDQVRARFDLDPVSTGQLSAKVLGEGGNDELGLAVLNADALDFLFALLDGGSGQDRCRTTPNVTVKNCP